MFGAILKATHSSFQKGMAFCRSIYVKKVMKLLAFIFEQPSYFIEQVTWLFCLHHLGKWSTPAYASTGIPAHLISAMPVQSRRSNGNR